MQFAIGREHITRRAFKLCNSQGENNVNFGLARVHAERAARQQGVDSQQFEVVDKRLYSFVI